MIMYIVNIAIKWANGDLEGFGASGLTEDAARMRAIAKATAKSHELGKSGSFIHLTSPAYRALSVEQQDQLQSDWDGESI